jgi:protein-disulfide isomerase
LPQITENYVATGKVVYIFYQLPLTSIHPNAQAAAEASECAGLQGKFWEMHDQLFGNQSEWSSSSDTLTIFKGYGAALGLDPAAFDSCLVANGTATRVMADSSFAASLGIGGTPFFVINQDGILYAVNGAQPYDSFQQGLDSLLAEP